MVQDNVKKRNLFYLTAVMILVFALTIEPSIKVSAEVNTASAEETIVNGDLWYDSDGNYIQGHGGNILSYNNTYYWVGEYKQTANFSGIALYSSTDLMNWKFENMILTPETPDDDGTTTNQAYIISACGHDMCVYKLTDDCMDVVPEESYKFWEGAGREAPSMVKANNYYVLITSGQSGWYPNQSMYGYTKDISDPDAWTAADQLITIGNNFTFYSQPTNIAMINDETGNQQYIYMGDRWKPGDLGKSTYVWLPMDITIDKGSSDKVQISMDYLNKWTFNTATGTFTKPKETLVSENKPISVSIEGTEAHPASQAVDGVIDTDRTWGNSNYYGLSKATVPFTMELDLEDVYDLSRMDLATRLCNGSETYYQYIVEGSVDGDSWTDILDENSNQVVGFRSNSISGDYRYVRITVNGINNVHNKNGAAWAAGIVEWQIYASEKTPEREVLAMLYESYKEIEKGYYTDNSYTAFTNALITSKQILEGTDDTDEECERASEALITAYKGLTLSDDIPVSVETLAVNELITHYTMISEGGKLTDVTGNGHDAALVGFSDSDITEEDGSKILTFTGKASQYVKLPDGAIGEDESFTIEATFSTNIKANQWLYCLGTKTGYWPNVTNYVFLNPMQGNGTIRYGIKDSSTELLSQTGSIDTSAYNTITAVFSEGSIAIYLNSVSVGTITHTYSVQSILADGVTDTTDCIGYIGKSLYIPDSPFHGKLKDFKVYNYALTAEEIETASALSDEEIVALAKKNLTIPNNDNIRGNITLPDTFDKGAAITWNSSNESIICSKEIVNTDYDRTPAGVVARQDTNTVVTLTATITSGLVTDTKIFHITVIKKPEVIQDSDYTDYLFTHFIGEDGNKGEQIYFSLSQDGFYWTDINKRDAVLTSSLGDGGVRDPFLIRGAYGDKFYLIATDLCIGGGTTWSEAQYSGSKSLIIWESDDLINWSEPRCIEVGVAGAGCVWAPEAIYDERTGEYIVYWASMVTLEGDTSAKQRIYYAKTRDFYTFTKPQIYLEKENHVIDTTMTFYNGMYYRYSKDEKTKHIVIESSNQLLNSTWTTIDSVLLSGLYGVEGPLIYKLNDDDASQNTWCLMVDQYASGKGYLPLITNDLSSGEFAKVSDYNLGDNLKRHGCVFRLTSEEYERLQKALTACFNNGYGNWDNHSGNNYYFSAPGTYTVKDGTITNNKLAEKYDESNKYCFNIIE